MQPKKNRRIELSTYSTLFFNIGLVISLGLVLAAFEWKSIEQKSTVNLANSNASFTELIDDIPQTKQTTPPPPRIQQPKIIEVPDDEELEVDIEINLDIAYEEETAIEEVVFEQTPEEEVADEFFVFVEEMPSFPGGKSKFSNFVSKNLIYPIQAKVKGIEGKVIVEFIVNEIGEISQVAVVHGIGYGCDEEAKRLIQTSPNWIPGKQAGKNVKVKMAVALVFDLS